MGLKDRLLTSVYLFLFLEDFTCGQQHCVDVFCSAWTWRTGNSWAWVGLGISFGVRRTEFRICLMKSHPREDYLAIWDSSLVGISKNYKETAVEGMWKSINFDRLKWNKEVCEKLSGCQDWALKNTYNYFSQHSHTINFLLMKIWHK